MTKRQTRRPCSTGNNRPHPHSLHAMWPVNNNSNNHNVSVAIIMTKKSLREFTQFI